MDMNLDEDSLSSSAIQNVLSNPEVLQELMMSQSVGQESDINGIKIGNRVLPVRMFVRDGKKIMQIMLPESPIKDFKMEPSMSESDIDMQTSMDDSSNQFLQTVDSNFIENLNMQTSLQDLPLQSEQIQANSMEFIQNSEALVNSIPSTTVYPNTVCYSESPLTSYPVVIANSQIEQNLMENQNSIIPQGLPAVSDSNVCPPAQDIVAAAFEESGLLQATANVISAVKYHYTEPTVKKVKQEHVQITEPVILSKHSRRADGKILYACNYGNCTRKFCNKIGLDIHLYTHTGLKPVTCKVCEKSFLSSKLFDKHRCKYSRPLQEVKSTRFECDLCDKTFGNIGTLIIHKRWHKGSKPYSCGLCSKSFTLKPSMYRHVKSHGTDVRYKCQTCDEMFRSPWHLEEHLMSHMNEKKVYNCSHCTKVFTNYPNYIRHVKSHSLKGKLKESELSTTKNIEKVDGLKCNLCLKSFSSVTGFQQHIQSHSSKRFQCSLCKKCFASKDYLQNHLQWYVAKFALGQPASGHMELIEKYKETNDLNVDYFLEVKDIEEEMMSAPDGDSCSDESAKTYLCDMCGNYFFTERALTRHIRFHDNIPYQCSSCDKKFTFRSNLIRHELTHEKIKEFQCNFCDKMFAQKIQLDEHVVSHTAIKPYTCNICNKKFARISNLRRHKQLHSLDKKYECPECHRRFVCARYLKEHVVNVHTSMGRRKRECPICHIQLSGNSNLNRHLNLHYGTINQNKKLECEYCEKRFEFQSDLDIHLRSHTGEKPFKCEKCDKCFMSMSNLRRHQTTHIKTKSHVCEMCGKAFKIERYLIDHMKIHTNPTKVTCDVCNMSFSSNTNMKRHKLIHSGEKPFSCNICNKKFRSKADVERHQLIHFKEKTEQCNLCFKKFKHKELLRRHMGKHERGVPKCNICNKEFPTNYKLQRHQQTHQDNFICNVCNSTFKTSLQLQKHVESHDIVEMRKLLLNMGTIKPGGNSPSKTVPKSSPKMKHTGPGASVKKELPSTSKQKVTNLSLLPANNGTPIITVSQIPISGTLTNVISISDTSQLHLPVDLPSVGS